MKDPDPRSSRPDVSGLVIKRRNITVKMQLRLYCCIQARVVKMLYRCNTVIRRLGSVWIDINYFE